MSLMRNEAKEIRGRILKILEIDYPNAVSDRVISLTLNDINYNISPAVLEGYLSYLEEKGYVEVATVESKELGISMKVAKLTAKGKDLLEGSMGADVGVSL